MLHYPKPEPPHRGWRSSAAALKHGNLRVWGPRSGPTEPRLFEPQASLRGGPGIEYCKWSLKGPAAVERQARRGGSGAATKDNCVFYVVKYQKVATF